MGEFGGSHRWFPEIARIPAMEKSAAPFLFSLSGSGSLRPEIQQIVKMAESPVHPAIQSSLVFGLPGVPPFSKKRPILNMDQ